MRKIAEICASIGLSLIPSVGLAAPQISCSAYFRFYNLFDGQPVQTMYGDVQGASCSFSPVHGNGEPGNLSLCKQGHGDPLQSSDEISHLAFEAQGWISSDNLVHLTAYFKATDQSTGAEMSPPLVVGSGVIQADVKSPFVLDATAYCEGGCFALSRWTGDAYAHVPVAHDGTTVEKIFVVLLRRSRIFAAGIYPEAVPLNPNLKLVYGIWQLFALPGRGRDGRGAH